MSTGSRRCDGGGTGTQRATIYNSVFENGRDGIDTTGGFKDSVISKSIFRNNSVTGLDLKKCIESSADLSTNYAISNIKITDSQFINNQNGIVVTMLDQAGLLTAANADTQMPHDIQVTNSIFEKTAGLRDRQGRLPDQGRPPHQLEQHQDPRRPRRGARS